MKNFIILLLSGFLLSCNSGPDQSTMNATIKLPIDVEKELAGIESTRDSFTTALKEGRYADIGKFTTRDVKTIGPGGPDWGKMYALGQERGRFPYDSIIMTPTETHVLNDSIAYDWGSSRVYYTNEEGEVVELRNSFLVLMKKEDGIWKLHREVGSSNLE